MLNHLMIGLILTSFSAAAFSNPAQDPTPEQCLSSFSKDYVLEGNLPNDYILSKDKKDIQGAFEVIKSNESANWVVEFAKFNLTYADAVGVVFSYEDETHMVFTSINIVGDKCQVKELASINVVDIQKSQDKTLLSKYFLGKSKKSLPEPVRRWLYDDVATSLKGE